MSGVLLSKHSNATTSGRSAWTSLISDSFRKWRAFLLIVVIPTLLSALYFGLVASNQYESSADFVVNRADGSKGGGGIGQLLGFNFGGSATASDAYVVQQYLTSHNAVERLRRQDDLIAMFRRPGTDPISRLWSDDPAPERLLKFYRGQVKFEQDEMSGITHMSVRTFRPEDSRALAAKLLRMGEEQVNAINRRTYADAVSSAERNRADAAARLAEVEGQLTAYRRTHGDIDPVNTSRASVTMIMGLTSNLATARARLATIGATVGRSSPQYEALEQQVASLEAQVNSESAKIAGPDRSVAARLGDYEQLVIKREQIARIYAASDAQLQQARADAGRQQMYLIRIVEPNLPVKAEFPKRGQTVLTIFAGLFFLYAIGWLLLAGVREHAM